MPEPSASSYPTSLDDDTTLFGDAVNLKQTTLSAGIDNSTTTVPCATAGINVPCYILIESEIIYAPTKDASNFTSCTRAAGGSSAAAHSISTAVYVVYAANYHNQVKRALIAIETELGPAPSGSYTDVQDAIAQHEYWSGKPIQGGLINGVIRRTIGSGNLTLDIQTLSGTDPSATSPVYVRIGDTVRSITGTLSVTKNAGTNWFNAGGSELVSNDVDYFAYLGYNATDGVVLGFARFSHARLYSDFNTTSTNEKYAAISTITTAAASDQYELVGRFNAKMTAGPGYNWSMPVTDITVSNPVDETRWLTWTPVWTGFSADPTVTYAVYKVTRNKVEIHIATTGGTSSTTALTLTGPWVPSAVMSYPWGRATDNGAALTAIGRLLTAATNIITAYTNMGTGAWTGAAAKNIDFTLVHRI